MNREPAAHVRPPAKRRTALLGTRGALVEAALMGEAILDQATVSKCLLHGRVQRRPERHDELSLVIEWRTARPFGEVVERLTKVVPLWAERRGKEASMQLEGRAELVPFALVGVLVRSLTHPVRNAVAHGLEGPQRRDALGKDSRGLVRLSCRASEEGIELCVSEDCRGLDEQASRARGCEAGHIEDRMGLQQAVFADTVSTAGTLHEMAARRKEIGRGGDDAGLRIRTDQGSAAIIAAPSVGDGSWRAREAA